MLEQRALDLERADQVARGLDHVVGPAEEPVEPVGVARHEVPGEVPAVHEAAAVAVVVVQVAAEHRRPPGPERQLTLDPRLGELDHPAVVDVDALRAAPQDTGLDTGEGASHRPGSDVRGDRVGDHDPAGLGLPPVVVDRQAEHLGTPHDGLGVQRFADARDESQRAEVDRTGEIVAQPHEAADRRRRGVPDGHVLVLQDPVPPLGVELGLVDDARDAVRERRDDPVRRPRDPPRVGGAPVHVVRVQVEGEPPGRVMHHDGLVDVHGSLRGPRGAAREVQQGRGLRSGGRDPVRVGGVGHQVGERQGAGRR
ncbi:hypothetical protein GALL_383180 [mine drainage metagenome]|uniref:Uncharacterized protein n=1 Tax=mine drainage metagenome TaxID=410659 RepID=A0A1J5Q8F4_9ZZZZ